MPEKKPRKSHCKGSQRAGGSFPRLFVVSLHCFVYGAIQELIEAFPFGGSMRFDGEQLIREIVRLLKAADWSDIFFVLYYLKAGE